MAGMRLANRLACLFTTRAYEDRDSLVNFLHSVAVGALRTRPTGRSVIGLGLLYQATVRHVRIHVCRKSL